MKKYDHKKIEPKWQREWKKKKIYQTLSADKAKAKKLKPFYVLDMFPYPSGVGLHVGHPRGYIGSDIYARMKRMQGFNVLHPMGYDAFGLPAEQYALEHKVHPKEAVKINVATFERQLSIIGLSYDWSRKVNTTDPEYYKWTQWIFLKLYESWYDLGVRPLSGKASPITELIKIFKKSGNENVAAYSNDDVVSFSAKDWKSFDPLKKQEILMKYRLAYEGESEVNWCQGLGTVLANDEVTAGPDGHPVSERGGFPVEKMKIRQWFLRITAYADRLLSGLEKINWPNHIKEIQKNWIGKSEGSLIRFALTQINSDLSRPKVSGLINTDKDSRESVFVEVFTTRADTLFGATYMVLAPEHSLVSKLKIENWKEVEEYINKAKHKTHEERTRVEKDPSTGSGQAKTGVELKGVKAINPANGEEIPVWISDYVLADYGTGAIMAVPAHDERDFEFAKKFKLPIKTVIAIPAKEILPDAVRRDGAICVLKNNKNEILVLQKRDSHEMKNLILPQGGIDNGEDPIEAAKRELEEETEFCDFKFEKTLGVDEFYYYVGSKGGTKGVVKNRHRFAFGFSFRLNSDKKSPVSEEDINSWTYHWLSKEDAMKVLVPEHSSFVARSFDEVPVHFTGEGILVNSGKFSFLESEMAMKAITEFVGGKIVTKYKMRDAIFARQRYWGEPIPLWRDKNGLIHEVKKLPLELPNVKSYEPTGKVEGPLAGVKSWMAKGYETNTMPGWAGSSWYFLRYMDPKNKKELVSKKEINYWKSVDVYVGGAEHATGHLLYARFWHKFLYDLGLVPTEEPFKELHNQGMILGADHRKMSKRWGNVVNPDDVVKTYGADSLRVFEMFLGPFDSQLPWMTDGIIGSRRFLERVWRVAQRLQINTDKKPINTENLSLEKLLHKTIKKVTEDIETMNFNTAISSMMILANEMERATHVELNDFKMFLQILAPFAPHITEELWQTLTPALSRRERGHSLHFSKWPKYDLKKMKDESVKIAVQVNGKVRTEIEIPNDAAEEEVRKLILINDIVKKWISGQEIKRFVYVKNKLVNIVV